MKKVWQEGKRFIVKPDQDFLGCELEHFANECSRSASWQSAFSLMKTDFRGHRKEQFALESFGAIHFR